MKSKSRGTWAAVVINLFLLAVCMSFLACEPELGPAPFDGSGPVGAVVTGQGLGYARIVGSGLGWGEVVLTFDESPAPPYTDQIAAYLDEQGITAVFFIVGKQLGRVGDDGSILEQRGEALAPLLEHAQLLANHSYAHPIKGAPDAAFGNLDGKSFSELSVQRQGQEIAWTHSLLWNAIEATYPECHSDLRPWFRSPGNSWEGVDASALRSELASYGVGLEWYDGPVGWNIPRTLRDYEWSDTARYGREDFRCLSRGDTPERCAELYFQDYREAGNRGIALFHGNLSVDGASYTLPIVRAFVERVRGDGGRFVSPDRALRVEGLPPCRGERP